MRDFDAIVVGAGLGGLSVAVNLAKAGKKVVLLEKHSIPGGYATSFVRGRFEFEVALHELSGYGNENDKGPIWRILHDYGVADKVKILDIPDLYRSVFPDLDITLPKGRQNFEDVMCSRFPKEADGIKKFMQTVFDFATQALKANRIGMKTVMANPSDFPVLMANFGKTLSEVLNPLVSDVKAQAVLGQTWGYYCQPPSKLSFLIYALALVSYLRFGPAHIRGTSQALSQAFIDTMEKYGCDVWLNNGVKKILSKNGKVYGVITEDGTEITSPYIVCNANPVITCLELIGRENVPDWYLKRLGAWSPGAATFNLYLGLDCSCQELGLTVHENFVNTSYDLDRQYENMRHYLDKDPDGIAVTAYNTVDPDISPPGTASVVMTQIAYAEPWLKIAPSEYGRVKHTIAKKMIDLAQRIAPGLKDHIEVMEIATPLTNMRYTGNPGGSIIGFDENFTGTGFVHVPLRGPLEGLYFSNAWVNIGGGFETCIASGAITSREVIKDMEKGGWEADSIESLKTQVDKQKISGPEQKDTIAPTMKLLSQIHPRKLSLQVKEVIKETASARTLRMVSAAGPLPIFSAGQYINLFVNIDGVLTSRPYSIASAPGKPYFDITVRRMEGGFVSNYLLDRVKAGDKFESTGPSGNFFYEPLIDSSDLVFLAGGSGITPFMSIIRETIENKLPLTIHLLYGSRDPGDIIFQDELTAITKKHNNIKMDYIMSEPPQGWKGPAGFLDAKMVKALVGKLDGKTFFVCGPAQMYTLCCDALSSLGVAARRIKREVYGPPQDITREPGWPGISPQKEFEVVELRTGRKLAAKAGEPLMISLERAGLVIQAVCRSGECTACRTKLVAGKVFAPPRVKHRWVDEQSNYIHPCMSYPLENLQIRI